MNSTCKCFTIFFIIDLRRIILAGLITIIFLNTNAQDTLFTTNRDFSANEKWQSYKTDKFSLKSKNGKLYINQRESAAEYRGLSLIFNRERYYNASISFDLKFINESLEAGFGMCMYTAEDKNGGYETITQFMLSPDGKLKYYSGVTITADAFMKLPSETCPSFKTAELNHVGLIRDGHNWYVIVNGDTVKRSFEERLEPLINSDCGDLAFAGKCEAEIDNINLAVLRNAHMEKRDNDISAKKLKNLQGSYVCFSSCMSNDQKRMNFNLTNVGGSSKFLLTGLSPQPIELYIEEKRTNEYWFDGSVMITVDGLKYNLTKFKITYEKHNFNMTFNLYASTNIGTKNCDVDGDLPYSGD